MRNLYVILMVALLTLPVHAQWTNPVAPTSSVPTTVMALSNGQVRSHAALSLPLLDADQVSVDRLEIDGTLYESASEIVSGGLSVANTGTVPGGPYGIILISKSGASVLLRGYVAGANGITVSNNSDGTLIIDGGLTNGVEALFPKSGTNTVGRVYLSQASVGNPYGFFTFTTGVGGVPYWDGTNWSMGTLTNVIGTASNTVLFNMLGPEYYRDFGRAGTNFLIMDDGSVVARQLLGIDAQANISVSMELYTNGTLTGYVARITGGGSGGSNDLLASANVWTESNRFTKAVTVPRIVLSGGWNTMSGTGAQALGGTNNLASGDWSGTYAGRDNVASGSDAQALGGQGNTASGSGSAADAGRNNNASGAYARALWGFLNLLSGDYAAGGGYDMNLVGAHTFGAGAHWMVTNRDVQVFGEGSSLTNRLTPTVSNALLIANAGMNKRLGVNTLAPRGALDLTDGGTAYVGRVVFPDGTSANSTTNFSGGGGGGGGSVTWTQSWAFPFIDNTNGTGYVMLGASNDFLVSNGSATSPAMRSASQLGLAMLTDVANVGSIASGAVQRTGEAGALDFTNTTVLVADPTTDQNPVTLGYLQSGAGGAVVTNAISSVTVNGTNYPALKQVNLADPQLSGAASGGTLTVTRVTSSDHTLIPTHRESRRLSTNDVISWSDYAGVFAGVSSTTASNNLLAGGFICSGTGSVGTAYRLIEYIVPQFADAPTSFSFRVYESMSASSTTLLRWSLSDGSQSAIYTAQTAAASWSNNQFAAPAWFSGLAGQRIQLRVDGSTPSLTNGVARYQLIDFTYGVRFHE